MNTETQDYGLTSREVYILGQALQIAKNELKKVNEDFREDSNINDMEDLQNMFPFTGIEKEYNFQIIIDLKDKKNAEKLIDTIKNNGVQCKVKTVENL